VCAAKNNSSSSISIEADSAEQDEKRGVITYKGNVRINQDGLQIHADKVQIIGGTHPQTGARQIEKILARGEPAEFTHSTTTKNQKPDGSNLVAEAEQIHYFVQRGVVRLLGSASLLQQGSSVTGKQIEYFIADQRVVAAADPDNQQTRVKTVIIPGDENFFTTPVTAPKKNNGNE
jgi:lipopolysaccharide export system protein LptA